MASYFFKRAVLFSTLSSIETSMEKFSAIVFFIFEQIEQPFPKNGDGVKIGEDAKCGAGRKSNTQNAKLPQYTIKIKRTGGGGLKK